jgi:hypothetical protein
VSEYKLTNDDITEFEEWWSDNHCEGDEGTLDEKFWAKEAFRYGIQYGKAMVTLDPREQDSYEETIRELTRINMELRQENAEGEISRDKLENEITKLRTQSGDSVMQASPYLLHLARKYDTRQFLYPEELEVLDEAGYLDIDELEEPPYDSPSLQDLGYELGSYDS